MTASVITQGWVWRVHWLGGTGGVSWRTSRWPESDADGERQPDARAGSGADTELLSGDFFCRLEEARHQLWSSAMVITPTLAGCLGFRLMPKNEDDHGESAFAGVFVDHAKIKGCNSAREMRALLRSKAGNVEVSLDQDSCAGWKLRSDQDGASFGRCG